LQDFSGLLLVRQGRPLDLSPIGLPVAGGNVSFYNESSGWADPSHQTLDQGESRLRDRPLVDRVAPWRGFVLSEPAPPGATVTSDQQVPKPQVSGLLVSQMSRYVVSFGFGFTLGSCHGSGVASRNVGGDGASDCDKECDP
jgi:hypothetical protein